jgi:hypothetical protein
MALKVLAEMGIDFDHSGQAVSSAIDTILQKVSEI